VFGFSGEKLLIIGLIALFVVGPDKLPQYAAKLAQFVKAAKRMAEGAKTQLESEIGEEVDWAKLDPRQYDPRRIIRDALSETEAPVGRATASMLPVPSSPPLAKGEKPPFDSEST
jgi:sec-independent protein translocase protein TatB